MPRVRLAVPAEQRKIEADLTEHCTGGARYKWCGSCRLKRQQCDDKLLFR